MLYFIEVTTTYLIRFMGQSSPFHIKTIWKKAVSCITGSDHTVIRWDLALAMSTMTLTHFEEVKIEINI